jgi:hypothetical protein
MSAPLPGSIFIYEFLLFCIPTKELNVMTVLVFVSDVSAQSI